MGQSSTDVEKDNRFKIQCLDKFCPINLMMAFLVKYIAFVVAFLSAAKSGEGIKMKLVDPTDAKSIQEYADLVKQEVCESFNPLNSTHMGAVGDCKSRKRCKKSATTLAHLLQVHYLGDNIEICTPKEGDRFWGVFSGSSSGSNSKSKTNSGGNSASQILAIGATAAKAFSLFG